MFVGRDRELEALEKYYRQDGFHFAVFYGRRRIGKTTLINHFRRDKKSIYFVAIESTAKENLDLLSGQILAVLAPDAPQTPFRSYTEAFDYCFQRARTERIIFVINEYPYLAESDKAVSSILQAAIDKYRDGSKMFLILSGSSMSFMENQVLGYKSPLYGRRTCQFKVLPFTYYESGEMLPGFTNKEKITLYGICGGIPEYLSRIDNKSSLSKNIEGLFFDPSGRLFEEPSNLLKQELKMPQTYNGIIAAIASGSSRLNEIATKVGIETSQCSNMLTSLVALGLVKKECPVTEPHSRRTIYLLADMMFRFWYRFVLPDLSRISMGLGKTVCAEVLANKIEAHTGYAFEECAKQFLLRDMGQQGFHIKSLGRWWGTNPREHREEEIDVLAFDENNALFGECKWQRLQCGIDTLEELVRKAELLRQFPHKGYILFSKSGFTAALKKAAASGKNIRLVTVEDMFRDTRSQKSS